MFSSRNNKNANIINERAVRQRLVCGWNEQTQVLFLAMLRQHRATLSELVQRGMISPNQFNYYNLKNDRLLEDATIVEGKFQRGRMLEDAAKVGGKIQRGIGKVGRKRKLQAELKKEIQREIRYLTGDIHEFRQFFFRQMQQEDDGKKETIISKLLFHMSIKDRSLMYKNLLQNNHVKIVEPKNANMQDPLVIGGGGGECGICLEGISFKVGEGETIVHSENSQCNHTFCEDCIVDYFSNKQRHLRVDPNEPMNPCPICRQEFCSIIIEE